MPAASTACATTDPRIMEDVINGIINELARCLCDETLSVGRSDLFQLAVGRENSGDSAVTEQQLQRSP